VIAGLDERGALRGRAVKDASIHAVLHSWKRIVPLPD
jgi:hypothetical protein